MDIFYASDQKIKLRPCSGFRYKRLEFSLFKYCGYRTAGIVEIAKINAFCRTDICAGRIQTILQPVDAECTFINISIRVRISCIIRTRSNTCSTSNTFIMLYKNYSSCIKMTRSGGAASYTGCIYTMITSLRSDLNFELRICPIHCFDNPFPAKPVRTIIFCLASNHAVAAPDTFFCIYCHCIPHDATSFLSFQLRMLQN
jgi:hypothetical protein